MKREHWLTRILYKGVTCLRCKLSLPGLYCSPWPEWSLHVIDPIAEKVLDANITDMGLRLIFADKVEEVSPQHARAMRELAQRGRYPEALIRLRLGPAFSFSISEVDSIALPCNVRVPSVKLGWHIFETRQEAEDFLIGHIADAY